MKNKKIRKVFSEYFAFSLKGFAISSAIIGISSVICIFLEKGDFGNTAVSMLFLLAVFLVSVFTKGYLFGTMASIFSVLIINFFFTYPYYTFNFTLEGYPLTII
ncbi:MAG: DUF4118 domain-containing protein [Clostridia bacterium]|nr:DUF4118 domain-containing protein [Clostridia bacterium]